MNIGSWVGQYLVAAAVAFYSIFLFGLLYFVIHPAIEEGSLTRAIDNVHSSA